MRWFGVPCTPRQLHYAVGDLLVALLAIWVAHAVAFGLGAPGPNLPSLLERNAGSSILFVCGMVIAVYVVEGYNAALDFRRLREILRLWVAVAVAMLVLRVVGLLLPLGTWGPRIAGLTALCLAAFLPAWRVALRRLSPWPPFRRNTLVVGTGRSGEVFADAVRAGAEHDCAYALAGFIAAGDEAPATHACAPVLGGAHELQAVVRRHRIDLIVVALDGVPGAALARELLACKAHGVRIEDMPTSYKALTGKVPVLHVPETWLVFGPEFSGNRRLSSVTQRLIDIVIALVGATLSAPVVGLAALAVRLESKGPAFYLQERLGRDERPFPIIKLRTMRQDAEAASGAVWSQGSTDPRVTRVGRFLRRSRIDELPQFYNVLRGDMSIVGPRPEREHFVTHLKERIPFYALRFSVKPGVTGWAQVEYRYGATDEDAAEKLCYELYAIQDMSPALYGLILLKTVQTVLLRPGS